MLKDIVMEATKVIHLEKANTLAQFLSGKEREELVSLKVTGFIGRDDFEDVLEDMCYVYGVYDDDDDFIPDEDGVNAIKHLDLGEAIYVDGDNLPHFGFHTQIETFILPQGLKSTLDGGEFETGLCGSDTLKTLVLPQGLKTVGGFCACENLVELVLPEGLEVIESNAFTGCDSITSIRIPASVEELYGSSFAGCNIEAYEVDEGNEHYTAIDGVVYTKDLKTLVAFPSAYPHKHFVVPSTTQVIGDSAFMDSKIESVDLPNGLSTIEYWAFEGASIRSIEIPDTVTEVGEVAFRFCRNLEHVKLSAGLTEIPRQMFSSCYKLKELDIPSNIKYIRYSALAWCDGLEILHLHDGLEEIVSEGPMLIREGKLREVVFPKTLKNVPGGVFNYSPYLNEYQIDPANPYFCVKDGALYSKDGKILYAVPNRNRTDFVIPEGVEEIGEMVFIDMAELCQITLPSTLRIIGERAFQGCDKLKFIRIPAGVEKVDIDSFMSCRNLDTIVLEGDVPPELTGRTGGGFSIYKNVNLIVPENSIDVYRNAPGWRCFWEKEEKKKCSGCEDDCTRCNVELRQKYINSVLNIDVEGLECLLETEPFDRSLLDRLLPPCPKGCSILWLIQCWEIILAHPEEWEEKYREKVAVRQERNDEIKRLFIEKLQAGFIPVDFQMSPFKFFRSEVDETVEDIVNWTRSELNKLGFLDLDIDLYCAVCKFDFEETERLLKNGANPYKNIGYEQKDDVEYALSVNCFNRIGTELKCLESNRLKKLILGEEYVSSNYYQVFADLIGLAAHKKMYTLLLEYKDSCNVTESSE